MPFSHNLDTAIASKQYLLYEPAMTSINGYEETYPEEIEDFCLVCGYVSAMACILPTNLVQPQEVWYFLEIDRVVPLKDFTSLVPFQSSKPEMLRLKDFFEWTNTRYHPYYIAYNSWHSFSFNVESAWGVDLLIYERDREFILVYINEWDRVEDKAIVTNYQLNKTESEMIRQFVPKFN